MHEAVPLMVVQHLWELRTIVHIQKSSPVFPASTTRTKLTTHRPIDQSADWPTDQQSHSLWADLTILKQKPATRIFDFRPEPVPSKWHCQNLFPRDPYYCYSHRCLSLSSAFLAKIMYKVVVSAIQTMCSVYCSFLCLTNKNTIQD